MRVVGTGLGCLVLVVSWLIGLGLLVFGIVALPIDIFTGGGVAFSVLLIVGGILVMWAGWALARSLAR